MAIASLILGIVAIVFAFIPFINFIAPIFGIVGIILGAIALKNLKAANQPTGTAAGGLVVSIIGTVLSVLIWAACAACIGGSRSILEQIQKDPNFQKSLNPQKSQDFQKALDELKKYSEQKETH